MSDIILTDDGLPPMKPNGHTSISPAELRTLTTSILLDRLNFMRQAGVTFGGARDEYAILGYDRIVTNKQYREEYNRGGIAGRIVDTFPNATWRGTFELIEDENPEVITPFEQAWDDLDTRLQIQAKLLRVDKLAGLSSYAVLLIGDGGDLSQELAKGTPDKLLYLAPYSGGGGPAGRQSRNQEAFDADCTIQEFDVDVKSQRFGLPNFYQLKRTDLSSVEMSKPVHWSRIIHVAEGLLDDEVYGLPALERVWNLLADLRKVTGGGAEAFWLRANQGLHMDVNKDMALDSAKDTIAALNEQSELYKHQMTRMLRTRGVDVTTLGSDVANFGPPADTVMTQIAGAKAIPKRILTGSEMGELASSQDRDNWRDQVNGRQTGYAGPYIIRPLVDRLIKYGYLPLPKKGIRAYEVRWPQITTLTETEKTAGAQAWAGVNSTNGEVVFTGAEIREKWADKAPLSDEQKQEIADAAAEKVKQAQEMMKATAKPGASPFGKTAAEDEEDDEDEKQLKAAEDVELLRVLTEALETGATEVVHRIVGLGDLPGHEFHGNQWTSGSGEGKGVVSQSFEGGATIQESLLRAKQAAKEAHKELVKAGFVKGETERKFVPSQKMGRSSAHSGSTDKVRTPYVHSDGRKATLIGYYPKYGTKSVSIHYEPRPAGTTAEPSDA